MPHSCTAEVALRTPELVLVGSGARLPQGSLGPHSEVAGRMAAGPGYRGPVGLGSSDGRSAEADWRRQIALSQERGVRRNAPKCFCAISYP